jgi:hypothetical protein
MKANLDTNKNGYIPLRNIEPYFDAAGPAGPARPGAAGLGPSGTHWAERLFA